MIETERLILREWRDADVPAHNLLCNDPRFMKHLGPPIPMSESRAAADRQNAYAAANGSCFWAVELRATGMFIGYCGIKPGPDNTPIANLPEIGWGIAPAHWRQGYAREAALACLQRTWTATDWPAVYAITTPGNEPSWHMMQRLGMTRIEGGDFDLPDLPEGDPLRRHILYRIDRPQE